MAEKKKKVYLGFLNEITDFLTKINWNSCMEEAEGAEGIHDLQKLFLEAATPS